MLQTQLLLHSHHETARLLHYVIPLLSPRRTASMSATLIRTKGIADIVTAIILIFRPNVIYDSMVTRRIHGWTGLVRCSACHSLRFSFIKIERRT